MLYKDVGDFDTSCAGGTFFSLAQEAQTSICFNIGRKYTIIISIVWETQIEARRAGGTDISSVYDTNRSYVREAQITG